MKRVRLAVLAVSCAAVLAACRPSEADTADGAKQGGMAGIEIEEKDGEQYYTFQDVEGNSYEAKLLDSVPKCEYDFSKLTTVEETGFKSYTDKEKGISSKMGIDVSEFQGEDIDWKQVKKSGIEFVFVRLGYRAYGEEGELVLDAMYDQNVKGALDAGLEVGVYFFSQAVSKKEAAEEAKFVLKHVKPYEITGPVVYDTEEIKWDTARTDGNTRQEFTDYAKQFCSAVEDAGYETMIYANLKWMAFTLDMEELKDYSFWYADYYELPQCPYQYQVWQFSETGVVPGINGNVDLNIWFCKDNVGRSRE